MIMASAAIEGKAQPDCPHGFRHIHHIIDAVFCCDPASFAIDHMIAIKASCKALLNSWIGKEIASKLPSGELFEGEIIIESGSCPITPRPHGSFVIALIPIAICITRGIKPIPDHAFAIMRAGKQTIHQLCIGVGRFVINKRLCLY